MQKQNGNFLLQALLALTLVFAFMPFFANKLASRDTEARLYSVVGQIETLHNVARIFLRDEFRNHYPTGTIVFSSNPTECPEGYNCNISALEPYGLPMGFNPQTIFHQNISLVATRSVNAETNEVVVNGYINLTRGDLTDGNLEWAQLLRMLGLYASGDGENINSSTAIHITVPVEEPYTDVVLRRETDENIGFLTELDMGGHSIDNISNLYANNGFVVNDDNNADATVFNLSLVGSANIDTPTLEGQISNFYNSSFGWGDDRTAALSLSGTSVSATSARFNQMRCKVGSVLSGTCGTVTVSGTVFAQNMQMLPENTFNVASGSECEFNGNVVLNEGTVYVYENDIIVPKNIYGVNFDFAQNTPFMDTSRTNGISVRDTLYTDRVVVGAGSPVFCTELGGCSGFEFGDIINVSDEESVSIEQLYTQNKIPLADVDINLTSGKVSLIPDILFVAPDGDERPPIDNNDIQIITNPYRDIATVLKCGYMDTVNGEGVFNLRSGFFKAGTMMSHSLVYNIVCQYFFYHKLERRLNHKLMMKCFTDGECH